MENTPNSYENAAEEGLKHFWRLQYFAEPRSRGVFLRPRPTKRETVVEDNSQNMHF